MHRKSIFYIFFSVKEKQMLMFDLEWSSLSAFISVSAVYFFLRHSNGQHLFQCPVYIQNLTGKLLFSVRVSQFLNTASSMAFLNKIPVTVASCCGKTQWALIYFFTWRTFIQHLIVFSHFCPLRGHPSKTSSWCSCSATVSFKTS